MNKERVYDIVIHGAGPVGCVSALLAHRLGFSVLLIDKGEATTYRGNAHYLNAYSLELLHQCGLDLPYLLSRRTNDSYAYSMAYGSSLSHLNYCVDLMRQPQVQQRYRRTGQFSGAANIPLAFVYAELLRILKKNKIPVLWSSQMATLDTNTGCCTVACTQQLHTFYFKYLLACDGVNSRVRTLCGIKLKKNHFQCFLNVGLDAHFENQLQHQALLYWVFHPLTPACFVMHSLTENQNIQIPVFAHQSKSDFEDPLFLRQYVRAVIGVDSIPFEITSTSFWTVNTFCLEQLAQDERVFFLGDSAHSCIPAGGLGLNCGLHDAANLVWKLKASKEESGLLASYQSERQFVAAASVRKSEENFRDFKAAAVQFGLPILSERQHQWLKRPYQWLQSSGLHAAASSVYHKVSKALFQVPWQPRSFEKQLQKTLRHFDGMDYHLGYNYRDRTFSLSPVAGTSNQSVAQSCHAGSLWFNQHIKQMDQSDWNLNWNYGRWSVFVFISNFKPYDPVESVDFYLVGRDFIVEGDIGFKQGLLIIRPDRIIDFVGELTLFHQDKQSIFKKMNQYEEVFFET